MEETKTKTRRQVALPVEVIPDAERLAEMLAAELNLPRLSLGNAVALAIKEAIKRRDKKAKP